MSLDDLTRKMLENGQIEACEVCEGSAQMLVCSRKRCPDCGGRKKKINNNGSFKQCNRCDKDGTIFYGSWVTCTKCKGTGIRTWLDDILRPSFAQGTVRCVKEQVL
jgi:hypothetical protein